MSDVPTTPPRAPPRVAIHETRADAQQAVEALQRSSAVPRRLAIVASDHRTEERALGKYGVRADATGQAGQAGQGSFVTLRPWRSGAIAAGLRLAAIPGPIARAHEAAVLAGKVLVVDFGAVPPGPVEGQRHRTTLHGQGPELT